MSRTLFWSLKKSARLRRIARKLTPKPGDGESIMRALAEGGFDAISSKLDETEEGKKELFTLIREDPVTSKLLEEYAVDDKKLNELYTKLVCNGAGVFKKGHWIPASTFAYGQTLEYLLKNKDAEHEDLKRVCARLWQYFSDNETGDIKD